MTVAEQVGDSLRPRGPCEGSLKIGTDEKIGRQSRKGGSGATCGYGGDTVLGGGREKRKTRHTISTNEEASPQQRHLGKTSTTGSEKRNRSGRANLSPSDLVQGNHHMFVISTRAACRPFTKEKCRIDRRQEEPSKKNYRKDRRRIRPHRNCTKGDPA